MKKAWHIVREPHFQYYLVDILSPKENTNKMHIKYQGQRYLVNKQQLLPYSNNQAKNICELEQLNEVEIIQFFNRQFENKNYWIKVNSKLVIDFNNNTQGQRQNFIKFILGRFLVTQKRRQYLCVSNHQSMHNKNGVVINTIFQVIKNTSRLWKYRISLDDLSRAYAIFFRDIPMKLKIYVKNGEIIKLSMTPYSLFSINLLGTVGTQNIINLKARIFNAMANSSRQIKNYYRVPYSSVPSEIENENLQNITNYLMHVGFTINQTKSILQIYSLIMSINCIEIVKARKQDKYSFKIRQGSVIKDNLRYLIGERLTSMLQEELNTYQESSECTKKNIELKQKLLMLIIYEEITLKMSQLLNEKMCNTSQTLQSYQQFILIQFPPTAKEQQKTAEQYYMEIVNKKIESMGLDIPFKKQTYDFKVNTANLKIKEQYQYDINKQILKEMEKSIGWLKNLRGSKFMVNFRINKLNTINNEQVKYRQGKVDELFEQLQNIHTNEYYENYIIQTAIAPSDLPFQLDLINSIKQSLQNSKLSPKEQDKSNDEQLLEVNFNHFKDRYGYCPSVKQLFRQEPNTSSQDKFDGYFKQNQDKGKMKNNQRICISLPFYEQLQNEREIVEINMNKIKNMMKTIKFRASILSNLSRNAKKIKLISLTCKTIYPQLREPFKELKYRYACLKLQQRLRNIILKTQKDSFNNIKKRSSIELISKVLSKKETQRDKEILFIKNMKKILKKQRCRELNERLQKFMSKKVLNNKKQGFQKLSREYNIVVNPPPVPLHQTQIKQQQNNSLNINPNNFQTPPKKQPEHKQSKIATNNTTNIPQSELANIPQQNQIGSKIEELSNGHEENQLISQQSLDQNDNSQSNYSLYGQSTNRGIQKSQTSRRITQPQLFSLADRPKFTFEIWCKQAVGFNNRKPVQPQQNQTAKILFNKPEGAKQVHKQENEQLNVDILIKQKIVVNPFFPYLITHIQAKTEDQIQLIMSHQQYKIKTALLKDYPTTKYPKTAAQIFNNLLKIGLDKNTSKSTSQLINMIVKPIRDTYNSERSNISTVFDGQPAIIGDYTWDHNLIKDQIFMQFIKQIMMNHNEDSLEALASALEIITRYYYPSPKFIYCFLHFLKSLQSKNIQKLNACFLNTLLFAQAYERYKGNNVTVIKDQIIPKQKQSYPQLQPRQTLVTEKQLQNCLTIQLRLINEQVFQFKVRNQTLSHYKRKMLKNIKMLHYQEYFGVYYCYQGKSTHCLMKEQKKAIDFLSEYPQTGTEHLLYIKLKYYFPFNIKQINKTRIMYLNSVIDERILPWGGKQYQKCVVLSMMFDQFQEYRISNYMIITNQIQSNIDLTSIQQKYTEMANQKGKKICEIQYFKLLKQHGFLAAKAYKVKQQLPQSNLYKITIAIIKPLQLCFYCGTDQKSSIDLHRIKGYAMQKGQIYLQLDYVDEEGHLGMRTLNIKNIDRIHQFYMDLTAYVSYLNDY